MTAQQATVSGSGMTDSADRLPLFREALIQAEIHHAGLKALKAQLGHAAGATPMDAADGVGELVRRLRAAIEDIEDSERADAELDAQLRELGIDPAELDDEEDESPAALPEWAQQGVLMMGGVSPLAMQMLSNSSWPWGRRHESPNCYEASWGWVHSKPSCRCPKR
jgi:hypothetical protein